MWRRRPGTGSQGPACKGTAVVAAGSATLLLSSSVAWEGEGGVGAACSVPQPSARHASRFSCRHHSQLWPSLTAVGVQCIKSTTQAPRPAAGRRGSRGERLRRGVLSARPEIWRRRAAESSLCSLAHTPCPSPPHFPPARHPQGPESAALTRCTAASRSCVALPSHSDTQAQDGCTRTAEPAVGVYAAPGCCQGE